MSQPYYLPDRMCIIIASHISKSNRIPYLKECLLSLIHQTIPVTIYLSISFGDEPDLQNIVLNMIQNTDEISTYNKLVLSIREKKTPQMRHIEMVYNEMNPTHEWILFSDDDDTYEMNRVQIFGETIVNCLNMKLPENQVVAGVYESTSGKDHREQRQEFWTYCVNRSILGRFLNGVYPYPAILENKCCDVLFAEYLRRSKPDYLFARLTQCYYNYRVDDNQESVTGTIQSKRFLYNNFTDPPSIDSGEWADYVLNWNDYLHENISVYLHDTYLRTLVGVAMEDILIAEFRNNATLFTFVDVCHLNQIQQLHEQIRKVCNEIYDITIK